MFQLRGLHAGLRPYAEYAIAVAHYYGIHPEITSVFRSMSEQRELRANYEQCLSSGRFGRAEGCMYPANRPGDSAHNYGLAWDSWVPAEHQATWNAIRRAIGFRVPDNDLIHAELPNWRSYVA